MASQPDKQEPTGQSVLALGIVGAGGFARFVRDAIVTMDGVRIAAVCDVDPGRAREFATLDGARALGFDELLADPAVDAVLIATPPADHAPMTVAALRAGKHVFCEKPTGMTPEEVAEVAAAVADSGRAYVVDHVVHHNPLVQLLVRLREAGVLDAVQRFVFENDAGDSGLGPDHWFWDPAHAGGILVEHGVHFFDVARAIDGTPETEVTSMVHRRSDGRVDTVVSTVRHGSGALATHAHGFSHDDRTERQLMRIDFGTAEARLTGWIPLDLVLDAWLDPRQLATLQQVCADDSWLAVPGYEALGNEKLVVMVDERPATLHTHDRDLPDRVRVQLRAELADEGNKPWVYAQGVRSAVTDLLLAIREGRTPSAGVEQGAAAVEVAHAGTLAQDGSLRPVVSLR